MPIKLLHTIRVPIEVIKNLSLLIPEVIVESLGVIVLQVLVVMSIFSFVQNGGNSSQSS